MDKAVLQCGLLGKKLGHSFSPRIHKELGDYEYSLFEKEEDEIEDFIKNGDFDGINVTIPYKRTVIPYLDEISDVAKRAGSVNTIVRRSDNSLYGDNTDVYGFMVMVRHADIDVAGAKVLILGSGGASGAVKTALEEMKATPVIISRSGENNYENLYLHKDAKVIVNTTPLGMYPGNGEAAVDLSDFPNCCGVLDLIYNPLRTKLILQAEKLGIRYSNGLYMLVSQAVRSAELFLGKYGEKVVFEDDKTDEIYSDLTKKLTNLVLIGMPGSGKSFMARKLSKENGMEIIDTDDEITVRYKRTPEEIINEDGEDSFRKLETEVLKDVTKKNGVIISTGGGVVTREENYDLLHQNGKIIWIKRDLSKLSTKGRPLSQRDGIEKLYNQREPLYRKFADCEMDNP